MRSAFRGFASAHGSEEQHRAKVPQSKVRNSMSSQQSRRKRPSAALLDASWVLVRGMPLEAWQDDRNLSLMLLFGGHLGTIAEVRQHTGLHQSHFA